MNKQNALHRCREIDCPYCYSEEEKKQIAKRKWLNYEEYLSICHVNHKQPLTFLDWLDTQK